MATCERCGSKTGFLQGVCDSCQLQERQAYIAQITDKEQEGKRFDQALSKILLSTGDLNVPYDVLDIVFVMAVHKASLFEPNAKPDDAFALMKRGLREKAIGLGANGIIRCQFDYRVAVSQVVHSQVFELFAYGTAVVFRSQIELSSK